MRPPTDIRKIEALHHYHVELMGLFKSGKLVGKVKILLKLKGREMGLPLSTYYENIRRLK